MISRRGELGEHYRLVQELLHDLEHFRRYFRMSTSQFDMLLDLIGPKIEKLDTNWCRSISPAERHAITLRSVLIKSVASFQQNLGGRPLPSLPFPPFPSPLRSKPLNPARGSGERCKLPPSEIELGAFWP